MTNSVSFIYFGVFCFLLMPRYTFLLDETEIITDKSHESIKKANQEHIPKFKPKEIKNEGSSKQHKSLSQVTNSSPGTGLQKPEPKEEVEKQHVPAEIHSSFEEADPTQSQDPLMLTNDRKDQDVKIADVTKELSETGQAVVFTLVDSASAELQHRAGSADVPSEVPRTDNATIRKPAESPGSVVPQPLGTEENKNGTISEEEQQQQKYVVRAEPKVVEQTTGSQVPIQLDNDQEGSRLEGNGSLGELQGVKASEEDSAVLDAEKAEAVHSPPEDIPSFSEWKLKHLAEDEQKKKDQNITVPPPSGQSRQSSGSKLHSKNYASPDCGAKIVAANPEATSASSVLSASRDEYLLNTCTSRIWFIVELCEAIQAKKIEIANFELFSSPPREFSVYVSDRFPTRDWQNVGNFVAEDERTIQSFNLHPHLFGKFIKVEFHTHYGSEHFCPVSLFRAYGTSEFEVLKTVDQVLEPDENLDDDIDDDDDEPLDVDRGEPSTIFDNARYAILSIVSKAAQALGKTGGSQNRTNVQNMTESFSEQLSPTEHCRSPRRIVVCDNCSDSLFADVYKLISCEENRLQTLIESSFVSDSMRDSKLCAPYGLDFTSRKLGAPYPLRREDMFAIRHVDPGGYLTALFPSKYIAALCNVLAVLEKRVALNVSEELSASPVLENNKTEEVDINAVDEELEQMLKPVSTCTLTTSLSTMPCNTSAVAENTDTSFVSATVVHIDSSIAAQIKPTKTLEKNDEDDLPPSILTASKVVPGSETSITEQPEAPETVLQASAVVHTAVDADNGSSQTQVVEPMEQLVDSGSTLQSGDIGLVLEESVSLPVTVEEPTQDNLSLDSLLNELKDLERVVDSSTAPAVVTTVAPPSSPSQQVQTESVFVRLANKIKALERNMSLSGQYLEELSRRYKKQVEDMQKSFNRTLSVVLDQNRKAEEREKRRMEEILELKQQISVLAATVETIVSERTGWAATGYALMQPLFFIVVFAVMLQYLKHHANHTSVPSIEDNKRRFSNGWRTKKLSKSEKRRRSFEGVSGHEVRKLKKRRPSEETLITGSYSELLIPDSQISEIDGGTQTVLKVENKRRRRRKKDSLPKAEYNTELVKLPNNQNEEAKHLQYILNTNNAVLTNGLQLHDIQDKHEVVQSSDGNQHITSNQQCSNEGSFMKAADTVTQHSGSSDSSLCIRGQDVLQLGVLHSSKGVNVKVNLSESVPALGQNNGTVKQHGLSPKFRNLSAPLFMKTAMSARSGRRSSEQSPTLQAKLKSDNWEWYSNRKGSGSSQTVTTVHNGDGSRNVPTSSLDRTGGVEVLSKENSKKQTSGLKKIGSWKLQSLFKS